KHSYHKNDWSSIQRQVERISKIAGSGDQSFEESIFMSCCSICETGEYRAWNEDDDIGGISPHKNENHWKLYVVLFLALGLCLNNYTKDEKGTTRYQEHTRALRRMHAEILRAGFGYNHFYDFYDLPRETEKEFFAKGATWDAEKHFCHAEGINCFDENDPQAYLMEVCQTLLAAKKPFYLYKLLLNDDFKISDWVKEWLIKWNIGKRIAEDTRLSNAQKRYIAEFAIKNWMQVPPDIFPDLQKHCIYEILKSDNVPKRTKIGIFNAIARKYITAVVKYGYGWEQDKTDELEVFKEGFSLMQDFFPLQHHSPNEVCGIADAIFARQNKLQFEYSTTEFAQSYSRYVSKISTEKIVEWDRHYAYMGIAHIVGEKAGARVIIEQLVPRLLAYFIGVDPAEYIYTSREVHRISKKHNIEDGACVIECYYCRQPVDINSDTCPRCHAELF
ncbi:MAG: hypothetical protein IKU58_02330, partial [Clostridia bacterium]|nr:hypothetical protein [Clostridia bacterium]